MMRDVESRSDPAAMGFATVYEKAVADVTTTL
jgi:hypothetical protein